MFQSIPETSVALLSLLLLLLLVVVAAMMAAAVLAAVVVSDESIHRWPELILFCEAGDI